MENIASTNSTVMYRSAGLLFSRSVLLLQVSSWFFMPSQWDPLYIIRFVSRSVVDPWHFVSDPYPRVSESYFAYSFLKVHLHNFSKIKSHKEVTKQ
jgi:hypothetical protein